MSDDAAWDEYRDIIRRGISETPRSLQVRIGPSEVGIPCDRCLARKLAGIPEMRGEDWLPAVGTAVHGDLAAIFRHENSRDAWDRFLVEYRVTVGEILGWPVSGSLDLYDIPTCELTDWKVVGETTRRKTKAHGPVVEYQRQLHLYARGLERAGWPVERVRIVFLPRNGATLDGTLAWSEPYDEAIAVEALTRAEALAARLVTEGLDVIDTLPALEGDCYSCSRYPRADGTTPRTPGHWERRPFAGII